MNLRKTIHTAFTPIPRFTMDDTLDPEFSFKEFWASQRGIYYARFKLIMLAVGGALFIGFTVLVVI